MPQQQFYPLVGCQKKAADFKTLMASSKARLFKSPFFPIAGTPRSDYLAAECDYDGYLAGGIVMTAFNDPILSPGSGYQTGSPLVQFAWAHDTDDVGNTVSGGWVETAGGIIMLAFNFAQNIPMQQAGQGIPLNFIFPFDTGL